MSTTVANALVCHLTHRNLAAWGLQALVAGSSWRLRFQLRENVVLLGVNTTQAVSLEGATAVMTVRAHEGGPVLWTRTSGVAVTGASPAVDQITFDGDQDAEDLVDETGKGWLEVAAENVAADRQALTAAAGMRVYDIEITLADGGDGDVRDAYAGDIEIGL